MMQKMQWMQPKLLQMPLRRSITKISQMIQSI